MSKYGILCLSVLLLSACSTPIWQGTQPGPEQAETRPADMAQEEVMSWLGYAERVLNSDEATRRSHIQQLRQGGNGNELQLALWLSHPGADAGQRRQAQQLLERNMSSVSPRLKQFFAVYQGYNRQMLRLHEVAEERQRQIDSLSNKLKELATIDEQISERKYQAPGAL